MCNQSQINSMKQRCPLDVTTVTTPSEVGISGGHKWLYNNNQKGYKQFGPRKIEIIQFPYVYFSPNGQPYITVTNNKNVLYFLISVCHHYFKCRRTTTY